MMRRPVPHSRLAAIVAVAAALVVSGCTGVPRSSAPQVVRSVDVGREANAQQPIAPESGANPRSIVTGLLQASQDAASGHSAARAFMTADARRIWQDNPTYLVDDFRVEVPDITGSSATVVVRARKIGSIDSHGLYTPRLEGSGTGGLEKFPYRLRKENGEWRVAELQAGVLLRAADFETAFRPRPLYFLDASEEHLVPDLRYSSLEGQQLATWMLAQLIAGPRPELASAVVNEIPEQLDPVRATATVADQIRVEIPGSSGIEATSLTRLAAELAYTFGPIQFASTVQLTDGNKAVDVPGYGNEFLASQFEDTFGRVEPETPRVFFLRNGAVFDDSGNHVAGPAGTNRYHLTSIAVRDNGEGNPRLAAVAGSTLMTGTFDLGLKAVRLPPHGALSRPTWQPRSNNVWVASGHTVYLVASDGAAQAIAVTETDKQTALRKGEIVALRFSPDGARVAFVLATPDGARTLFIATLVGTAGQIRIVSADAVTPQLVLVADVDWSNATSLAFVASESGSGAEPDASIWTVQSDGSMLRAATGPAGLPGAPQTVTAASGQFTVVSAGGAIWVQRSSSWTSLDGSGTTTGENPVYAE